MDIPKIYDPKQAEQHHYARWERLGYFAPEINCDPGAPVFSIAIPPPNVTGSLHMGHALQHTMMDVLTRYKRMCGNRIVNWCPNDQTVLSDLEVEKTPLQGKLYYLQYPVKDSDAHVTVATTRPETMLGDTAVAVNPNDERYRDLEGATLLLPLTGREISVIADEFVDPEFGTGAVKVTPAHDPNDYDLGVRHNLPQVVVIDGHAKMTEAAGSDFAGLDRYRAREKVVGKFEELGLLETVIDYEFSISKCERCKTVIEPLISTQWFLRMDQLRDLSLDLVAREQKSRFVPEVRYDKAYTNWFRNFSDW